MHSRNEPGKDNRRDLNSFCLSFASLSDVKRNFYGSDFSSLPVTLVKRVESGNNLGKRSHRHFFSFLS